jgi:hypothetical protein
MRKNNASKNKKKKKKKNQRRLSVHSRVLHSRFGIFYCPGAPGSRVLFYASRFASHLLSPPVIVSRIAAVEMSLKVGKDALEGLVQMDDLLMAMAESVMERQPKPFNPQLLFRDRKIEFKIGGRPPREVFYRKTTTFLTKLPPPVTKKLCTCKFLCTAGEQVPAVIKCHSCSIYDPSGASYYCQHCFNGRHPWYRVDHIYTKIDQDENIEYNLKVAHRLAEAARYEREGNDLLQSLQKEVVPKLEYVRNDEEIDDKMRIYGSHVTELEENIKALRQRLQDELQRGYVGKSYVTASQPPPKDLTSAADNEGLSLTTTDQNAISPPAQKEILKLITNEKRSRTTKLEQEPQHEKTNEKQHQPIKPLDSHGLKSLPSQISVMATEDYPETLDHKRSVLRASSHGDLELLHTGSNDALEEITRPASVDSSEAEHYKATNFDSNNSQMHALHGDSNNRQEESTESNKSSSILPSNTPKGHHRAAVNLQKLFKGYIGRKIVSSIMTTRIVRVFSTDYGRGLYRYFDVCTLCDSDN